MKINNTMEPRLPINRLKHPLKPAGNEPDEPQDVSLAGKEGEELDKIVRRLYNSKIRNEIDTWLEMRNK